MDLVSHDFGLDLENGVYLLCSEENVGKICRKIKFKGDGAEETKEQCIYFHDAEDETQRESWRRKPKHNVPENMLPFLKMQYNAFCPRIKELIENTMDQRITPKILEPSLASYLKAMKEYDDEAQANPKEQFLFI